MDRSAIWIVQQLLSSLLLSIEMQSLEYRVHSKVRSNSKLEGLNSKIRLINHRGCGHHPPEAVIAIIYLCCGEFTIELPTSNFS